MPKPLHTWPHVALIIAIMLLPATGCGQGQRLMKLGAKPGSSKEEGTRQPEVAMQVLEVPHDGQEDTWSPFEMDGRLLGGMQRSGEDVKGGDEKVRVEEQQSGAETIREQDAKQFTRSLEFATQEMPNASFTHPAAATQYGFKAKKIDNDGNCLFRAVADQLENQLGIPFAGGVSPYMVLRRIAANHISSNVGLYKPFTDAQTVAAVEKLIANIEQDREWAGDEALAILSRALQVTIVVVRDKAANVTVYKPAGTSNGTLYLYYKNLSHYESLYRDSKITATASLEEQVKSQAADKEFIPEEIPNLATFLKDTTSAIKQEWAPSGPDLPAFVKDEASAIEQEWVPSGMNQWGAVALAKRKEGPTPKALAEVDIQKLKEEIDKLYSQLLQDVEQEEMVAKLWRTLLKHLEDLLALEDLWGTDPEEDGAQEYLEGLSEECRTNKAASKKLELLLEKAYSQTLSRVVEEMSKKERSKADSGQLKKSSKNTEQLVAVLERLAKLHQAQGAQTGNVKYYTDAAVLYQTILHACAKDKGQDHSRETKAVYEGLAKVKAGMLACSKAKGKPLSTAEVQADIKQDRKELQQLRAYAKQRVDALDAIIHKEGMTKEEERKAEETFIKGSEKLFGEITEGMKQFMARLYKECEQELGPAPCKYTVIGMGSMALQHITPYSDLELAIIMETPKDKATAKRFRDYLRKLTHLFHLRIINLGETVVPVKRYGVSLDHICKMGVQFDLGGKTPLNRIDRDKPYDLIQPVAGMMRYLKNEDEKAEHADKLLPYLLESTCPIHGDKDLYETYAKARATFLTTGKTPGGTPVYQARALHLLVEGVTDLDYFQPKSASGDFSIKSHKKGTLYQFEPKFINGTTSEAGKLYNVKQEIYRLPDRLLYGLAAYYGILPKSSWDAVAQLANKGVIKADKAAHHLQYAASFATMLRLRTYLHHQGQSEKITIPMGLSEEAEAKEVQAMFCLPPAALQTRGSLFKYYYTVLPLHSKMKHFFHGVDLRKKMLELKLDPVLTPHLDASLGQQGEYSPEATFFHSETFHNVSDSVVGDIYHRLLQYSKTRDYWQKALEHDCKLLGSNHPDLVAEYSKVGNIYQSLGKYTEALKYLKQALHLIKAALDEQHPDHTLYISVAVIYNNIGSVYLHQDNYQKAIEHLKQGLHIWKVALGAQYSYVAADIYNNIGLVYQRQGHYEAALEHSKQALRLRVAALGEQHPDVAASHSNIGSVYLRQDNYQKAIEHLKQGLHLQVNAFVGKHPNVATSYNNLGLAYLAQSNYKEALKYLKIGLQRRMAALGEQHPDVAASCGNIGLVYSLQSNYPEALKYYQKALHLQKAALGEHHSSVAGSLTLIGNVYAKQGNYPEALKHLKQGLNIGIGKVVLEKAHPYVAGIYNKIGNIYTKQDNYSEALKYLKQALHLIKAALGEQHPDVAISHNNIGLVYSLQSNYPEALKNYQKALQLQKAALGEQHPDVATSYDKMSNVYQKQGNYPEALKHLKIGLRLRKAALGEQHPDVADSYNNIGKFYSSQGNYPDALQHYQLGLRLRKDALGEHHPNVAASYNNIGVVYLNQGNYPEALQHLKIGLRLRKDALGEYHPNVADSYNNIGLVYLKQGNYPEALKHLKIGLQLRKAVLGEQHPDVAASYNNIGTVCRNQGNYAEALKHLKIGLHIWKSTLSEDHPDVATSYNNIGIVCRNQGNYAEALKHLKQGLRLKIATLGEKHPSMAVSHNNIGNVYRNQGNYAEALKHLKQGLRLLKAALGEKHPSVAASYGNIGLVYQNQAHYAEALKHHQQALYIYQDTVGLNHPHAQMTIHNLEQVRFKLISTQSEDVETDQKQVGQKEWNIHTGDVAMQQAVAASCDSAGKTALKEKDYKKAQDHYEQSLKIRQELYADNPHADVAKSYMGLGLAHKGLKEYQQAIAYLKKSLAIRMKAHNTPAHVSVATVHHNLGNVYRDSGNYKQAEEQYERALELFKSCVAQTDRRIKLVTKNLRQVREKMTKFQATAENRDSEQEDSLLESKNEPESAPTENSDQEVGNMQQILAASCDSEAAACLRRQDYPKAQAHYEQGLKIRQAMHDKPHVNVANSHSYLGQVHLAQKNYEAAEEHFRKAHELYSECLGEEHPTTQKALEAHMNVYMAFEEQDTDEESKEASPLESKNEPEAAPAEHTEGKSRQS